MVIGVVKLKLYTPWVHSLKEKRMEVKSIIAKARNKFNITISEVEEQDIHQTIVIGFACVAGSSSHADSMLDNILYHIEANTEGEVISIEREIIIST